MSWLRSGPELAFPRPGPDVCPLCFNLEARRGLVCRACEPPTPHHLERVVPISYSIGGGRLHAELAAYKRDADPFVTEAVRDLAVILNRFLLRHELCVGAGRRFELVTTVPSSDPQRDARHPLRRIVADLLPVAAARHQRLLRTAKATAAPHVFDDARFAACRDLAGERILLIDDTWTTGASAQSAAARSWPPAPAGSRPSWSAIDLRAGYGANRVRVAELCAAFDWGACVLCASNPEPRGAQKARPAVTRW